MLDYMIRYSAFANSGDGFQNTVRLGKHMTAWETRHRPSIGGHKSIPDPVFRIVDMLTTVQFDDQFQVNAREISDIITNDKAAMKFDAI